MVELVVNAEQAKLLAEAQGNVEIIDCHGNRLGVFAKRFSDREIEVARERAAAPHGGRTSTEVLDRLESHR